MFCSAARCGQLAAGYIVLENITWLACESHWSAAKLHTHIEGRLFHDEPNVYQQDL
jgi:hypothetical protein